MNDKAKKIKELREDTGMNRREFCERFNIPYRTVTEWERDMRHAPDYLVRLLEYYIRMEKIFNKSRNNAKSSDSVRNVSVIKDTDGNNIVIINDIVFKGKRSLNWDDVELYLKNYVGDFYSIAEDGELVFIGKKLPSEYSGSVYTKKLKGAVAKAKANAAQGIPEMIEIATNGVFEENRKKKHGRDAQNGWYRYDTRFGLPVYSDDGDIKGYNIFHARLLIRHASSGKKYLYDVMEIKKETSKSCQAAALPSNKPIS